MNETSRIPERDLSVVIPFFDEQATVSRLMERLYAVLDSLDGSFEVIAVDDGSRDGTLDLLRWEATSREDLVIVPLGENRGQHRALLEGLRRIRGRWVITLDADLQNPPEEIPRLFEALRGGHDKVGTYRQGRRDPVLRKVSSRAINLVARRLTGLGIRDFGCMLRGYSREVIERIVAEDDRLRDQEGAGDSRRLYLPARGYRFAENPVEIAVRHSRREDGRSRYTLPRLIDLSLDLISSSRPGQEPEASDSRLSRISRTD